MEQRTAHRQTIGKRYPLAPQKHKQRRVRDYAEAPKLNERHDHRVPEPVKMRADVHRRQTGDADRRSRGKQRVNEGDRRGGPAYGQPQ